MVAKRPILGSNKVRALCAQIAIELDRSKRETLLEELCEVILRELGDISAVLAEEADGSAKPKPN